MDLSKYFLPPSDENAKFNLTRLDKSSFPGVRLQFYTKILIFSKKGRFQDGPCKICSLSMQY